MRKMLVGFLLGVTTVSCLFLYNKSCMYSRSAVVEDYDLNDCVALTMSDNGTDWDIKDDKIIEARYDS